MKAESKIKVTKPKALYVTKKRIDLMTKLNQNNVLKRSECRKRRQKDDESYFIPNNSNETISASQTQTELTSEKVTTLESRHHFTKVLLCNLDKKKNYKRDRKIKIDAVRRKCKSQNCGQVMGNKFKKN